MEARRRPRPTENPVTRRSRHAAPPLGYDADMEETLVTVATYPQPVTAHMARNFLEGHGVRAFVIDERLARQPWDQVFGVKVQVPASDAQRATELLESVKQP
jgi:Putative prokaryotic signal transducing protein